MGNVTNILMFIVTKIFNGQYNLNFKCSTQLTFIIGNVTNIFVVEID
jgi:hypothetical protein